MMPSTSSSKKKWFDFPATLTWGSKCCFAQVLSGIIIVDTFPMSTITINIRELKRPYRNVRMPATTYASDYVTFLCPLFCYDSIWVFSGVNGWFALPLISCRQGCHPCGQVIFVSMGGSKNVKVSLLLYTVNKNKYERQFCACLRATPKISQETSTQAYWGIHVYIYDLWSDHPRNDLCIYIVLMYIYLRTESLSSFRQTCRWLNTVIYPFSIPVDPVMRRNRLWYQ